MRTSQQRRRSQQSSEQTQARFNLLELAIDDFEFSRTIKIQDQEVTICKSTFGMFLKLERLWSVYQKAKNEDPESAFKYLRNFVIQGGVPEELVEAAHLYEFAVAASTITAMNVLIIVPRFLKNLKNPQVKEDPKRDRRKEQKKQPWEYDGRMTYVYFDMLARNYRWSLDQISELYPEDALLLIQECLIEEQNKMEWDYTLSDKGYRYDSKSGKTTGRDPFPKPSWMIETKMPSVGKIRKDMLPVGVILQVGKDV